MPPVVGDPSADDHRVMGALIAQSCGLTAVGVGNRSGDTCNAS